MRDAFGSLATTLERSSCVKYHRHNLLFDTVSLRVVLFARSANFEASVGKTVGGHVARVRRLYFVTRYDRVACTLAIGG